MATAKTGTMTNKIADDGSNGISYPKEIADEMKGGESEKQMDSCKNCRQGKDVKDGFVSRKRVTDVVDRCYKEDENKPGQRKKNCKRNGLSERIEGGMEIEMYP